MLYKYQFVKHQKLRELSFHFLFFMRKIKNINEKSKFTPNKIFHTSFLKDGKVAPRGRIKKDLQDKFELFFNDFKKIDKNKKNEFYELIDLSQNIHLYFEDETISIVSKLQTKNVKNILDGSTSFNDLMDALWNYLKSPNAWEIDKHYEDFYGKLPNSKMCAFCGLNKISDKDLYRSDYDHIAFKAKYPISAINIKNIAPSCSECNSKFKTTKDVFFSFDKNKRNSIYYPFNIKNVEDLNITLDLDGTNLPNIDVNDKKGTWNINIYPDDTYSKTWDKIYRIKKRYIKLLNINYLQWNEELVNQCDKFADPGNLSEYIKKYKTCYNPNKLRQEYHIKYAYYDFLERSMNDIIFNQINAMIA